MSSPSNVSSVGRTRPDANFSTFAFVVDVYVETTICVLGIVGNAFVIHILRRGHDDLYSGMRLLYQLLGVADVAYLATCLVFKVLNMVQYWSDVISRVTWSYLDLYFTPLFSVTKGSADWHVVMVSLGTYVTVCKPLWAKRHLSIWNISRVSVMLWIFSLIYHIPMFLEYRIRVVELHPNITNMPAVIQYPNRTAILNSHHLYRTLYHISAFTIFRLILPLALLIFGNIMVIREIHRLDALRQGRESKALSDVADASVRERRSPRKYASLLKAIVAVYCLCAVPHFIIRTMFMCLPRGLIRLITFNDTGNILSYLAIFTSLMYKINSCCNIVIFSVLRPRFRTLVYRTCTCQGP